MRGWRNTRLAHLMELAAGFIKARGEIGASSAAEELRTEQRAMRREGFFLSLLVCADVDPGRCVGERKFRYLPRDFVRAAR